MEHHLEMHDAVGIKKPHSDQLDISFPKSWYDRHSNITMVDNYKPSH